MGICSSSDATSVATAKLILCDGTLQEFSYPVKVSYLLTKFPNCFICNSDEMEFDDYVLAINEDEEIQVGHLYFALPLSKLRHPLQAEDLAALAVKASLALMKSGTSASDIACLKGAASNCYDGKQKQQGLCSGGGGDSFTVGGGGGGVGQKKKRSGSCGGRARNFTPKNKLTAIPE
ncbi:hypothetical protein AQUCO_01000373v1 [Aquilegia coerulea]|uniref:Uncharacterized protein n=1 Tax=Aquilegia coerulea TaxID=218851 RepID=A0A2G5E9P2_AQUCA|nr:hypothetical protein AQUCO_01000373v1 [Aquilegia coerulea]